MTVISQVRLNVFYVICKNKLFIYSSVGKTGVLVLKAMDTFGNYS